MAGVVACLPLHTVAAQTPTPTPTGALVRISQISDLSFGSYSGSGTFLRTDNICVYNNTTDSYRVTFTTDNGSFSIQNAGRSIPFTVRFKETNSAYSTLSYNTPATFGGANRTNELCFGLSNAKYEVSFTEADLLASRPGTYTATITIIIEQP